MKDDDLAAFRSAVMRELDEFRSAVVAELGKLGQKVDALHRIASEISRRQFEREHEEDRYRRRLKAVEGEVERVSEQVDGPNWQRDPRDITGAHQLRELTSWRQREEQRRHDSGIWWKRQRWLWTGVVVTSLIVASVVGCVGYVVSHVPQPAVTVPKP